MRSKLQNIFGCDLRSLALFRMVLGLLLIADLAVRLPDIVSFYTDAGLLPRAAAMASALPAGRLSFYFLNGSTGYALVLFGISALAALALAAGLFTRAAAAVSWLMLMSLHNRNILVDNASSEFLRLLLFWSLFLPMGERFSVDRFLKPAPGGPQQRETSAATAALLVQVACVYFFTGLMKAEYEGWHTGASLVLGIADEQNSTPLAMMFLQHPALVAALGRGVLFLELAGPVLLFFPIKNLFFRAAALAGFLAMQAGIALTLNVGLFPAISMAAFLPFLPSEFWEALGGSSHAKEARRGPTWLARNFLAGICLVYVLVYNLQSVKALHFRVPKPLQIFGHAAGLTQEWGMFAQLRGNLNWFVAWGRLENGQEMDLWKNRPVSWEKPTLIAPTYRNEQWRKYLNTTTKYYPRQLRYFTADACRAWDAKHGEGEKLREAALYFLTRLRRPDGTYAPVKKLLLWKSPCSWDLGPRPGEMSEREKGGKLSALGEVKDGVRDGEWTFWYPDGGMKEHGYYQKGLQTGFWQSWYQDAAPQEERYYNEGKAQGRWNRWPPQGGRPASTCYDKGREVTCPG